MEIKTTKEICQEQIKEANDFFNNKFVPLKNTIDKKWVAVEDIIKKLKEISSVGHYTCKNNLKLEDDNLILWEDVLKIIKELKQEGKKW